MRDVYVWRGRGDYPSSADYFDVSTDVLRVNYYTSVVGDDDKVTDVSRQIADLLYFQEGNYYGGCQLTPRVFKKKKKDNRSRLVGITLAIDAMRHACNSEIDVAYIFSGDGDFVELAQEVARQGVKVCVSAFSSGLSPRLPTVADRFRLLDEYFFENEELPRA